MCGRREYGDILSRLFARFGPSQSSLYFSLNSNVKESSRKSFARKVHWPESVFRQDVLNRYILNGDFFLIPKVEKSFLMHEDRLSGIHNRRKFGSGLSCQCDLQVWTNETRLGEGSLTAYLQVHICPQCLHWQHVCVCASATCTYAQAHSKSVFVKTFYLQTVCRKIFLKKK